MYCDKCGAELKEGITYCSSCGVKLNEKSVIPSKKRTTGLSIISIFFIISGLYSILGLVFIMMIAVNTNYIPKGQLDTYMFIFYYVIVGVILGLGYLWAGYGLWALKKWARNLAIIVAIIAMIINIIIYTSQTFLLISHGSNPYIAIVYNLIITGIIVWYLSKPKIKKLFDI